MIAKQSTFAVRGRNSTMWPYGKFISLIYIWKQDEVILYNNDTLTKWQLSYIQWLAVLTLFYVFTLLSITCWCHEGGQCCYIRTSSLCEELVSLSDIFHHHGDISRSACQQPRHQHTADSADLKRVCITLQKHIDVEGYIHPKYLTMQYSVC